VIGGKGEHKLSSRVKVVRKGPSAVYRFGDKWQ
jgi:hypothetical protein